MTKAKVIKTPNNLAKAKMGAGRARLDPELLARAEKAVETIQETYTDWANEDIAAFDACLVQLRAADSDHAEIIKELFRLSLDMKGQGGSFGYIMMSEVAASLNDFIATRKKLEGLDIHVIDAHIAALHAIYGQRVRGDGGMTGRALLTELEKLVAKADVRVEQEGGNE